MPRRQYLAVLHTSGLGACLGVCLCAVAHLRSQLLPDRDGAPVSALTRVSTPGETAKRTPRHATQPIERADRVHTGYATYLAIVQPVLYGIERPRPAMFIPSSAPAGRCAGGSEQAGDSQHDAQRVQTVLQHTLELVIYCHICAGTLVLPHDGPASFSGLVYFQNGRAGSLLPVVLKY